MKKINFLLTSALLLTSFVVMHSCSKDSGNGSSSYSTTSPPSPTYTTPTYTTPTATAAVTMKNMAFVPASITVAKGTVITWTNGDPYAHTVNSNDSTTISSNGSISSGYTFKYTATVAGTIPYHCLIHGLAMSGTITVTP